MSWAAQTALRDIIGRTALTDLLRGRERIETELQQLIDARSNPWGITVQSVEMRDVVIPNALQDAMSREAQAAREKQARIILGQAEMEIARSFQEAAKAYQDNPTALHLRAMNMLYEGLKEKGALMLVPSSAVESMGMGGLLGAAALQQQQLTGGDSGQEGRVRGRGSFAGEPPVRPVTDRDRAGGGRRVPTAAKQVFVDRCSSTTNQRCGANCARVVKTASHTGRLTMATPDFARPAGACCSGCCSRSSALVLAVIGWWRLDDIAADMISPAAAR